MERPCFSPHCCGPIRQSPPLGKRGLSRLPLGREGGGQPSGGAGYLEELWGLGETVQGAAAVLFRGREAERGAGAIGHLVRGQLCRGLQGVAPRGQDGADLCAEPGLEFILWRKGGRKDGFEEEFLEPQETKQVQLPTLVPAWQIPLPSRRAAWPRHRADSLGPRRQRWSHPGQGWQGLRGQPREPPQRTHLA